MLQDTEFITRCCLLFRQTYFFGATALVQNPDGTKIWRNRKIDRNPFTIEAPFEKFTTLVSFENSTIGIDKKDDY